MFDDPRTAFFRGVRDVLPVVVGVIPFGLIVGVSAVGNGLTAGDAAASSVLVFAGASQLAMIDLLGRGAPVWVAVLTAAVINLRMVMYSASLSPWWDQIPRPRRLLGAYTLVDQSFALAITRYSTGQVNDPQARFAYYLGLGIPLWVNWQLVTVVGAVVGAQVPEDVPLAATIPLVFLAVVVPAIVDRPTLVAAIVGGVVAVVAAPLPANLGLIVGAVAGITAGTLLDARSSPSSAEQGT